MGSLKLIDALEENSDKGIELSDEKAIQERPLNNSEEDVLLALQHGKIKKQEEEIKDLQQDREQRKYLSYALCASICLLLYLSYSVVD